MVEGMTKVFIRNRQKPDASVPFFLDFYVYQCNNQFTFSRIIEHGESRSVVLAVALAQRVHVIDPVVDVDATVKPEENEVHIKQREGAGPAKLISKVSNKNTDFEGAKSSLSYSCS